MIVCYRRKVYLHYLDILCVHPWTFCESPKFAELFGSGDFLVIPHSMKMRHWAMITFFRDNRIATVYSFVTVIVLISVELFFLCMV